MVFWLSERDCSSLAPAVARGRCGWALSAAAAIRPSDRTVRRCIDPPPSKIDLKPQLQFALVLRRRDFAEGRASQTAAHTLEQRSIEKIERLCAELPPPR